MMLLCAQYHQQLSSPRCSSMQKQAFSRKYGNIFKEWLNDQSFPSVLSQQQPSVSYRLAAPLENLELNKQEHKSHQYWCPELSRRLGIAALGT